MRPTRTIRIKELSGLTMHQLLDMPDDEYLALEEKHKPVAFPVREVVKVKNGVNVNYDIRKTWATASTMDKGRPPEGLGVSSSSGFIR